MKAVVVAHGDVRPEDRAWLRGADLIVAADGGALTLDRWGALPNAVVGDMDSLDEATLARLRARGVVVEQHARAKDLTDLELALGYARAAGADDIVILGAFGGPRFDHALANATVLAGAAAAGATVVAVDGPLTARALRGPGTLPLRGDPGDLVSLVPLGDVRGVRTHGLAFPLYDETLEAGRARGVSNVIVGSDASVGCDDGALLVLETREVRNGGAPADGRAAR